MVAKLAKGLMVPFSWLAYGDTSEFISSPLPEGETEYSLTVPSEVADYIDKKSAELGIPPHEVARKMLELFYEHNSLIEDGDKKPT